LSFRRINEQQYVDIMSTSNDDNDSDPDGNAHVLYVDHQGHPAPLAECYHATASRRLSSSIDRYPSSTVTEVDSAFCPQCLSFHDAATAAALGYCPKATCQQCPLCTAIASVTVAVDSGQVFYECSGGGGGTSCQWTSKECNLMVTVTKQEQDDEDGSFDKIELARALEDLGTRLVQRKREKQEASDKYFNSLTGFLEQRSKVERQAQRISKVSAAAATADGPEGWSVEALEATLEEKKTSTMFVESDGAGVGAGAAGRQVEKISLENNDDEIVDSSLSQVSLLSLQLQSLNYSTPPRSKQDLLPLPIPLRVRTSRRCRAELAEGRPGILLKPKLNPLEGDTSLRSGHGQWWKKVRYVALRCVTLRYVAVVAVVFVVAVMAVLYMYKTAHACVHDFLLTT
jgi:dynactin-4